MIVAKNIPRATVHTDSIFRSTCADYIYNYVASDKSLSERNKLEGVASMDVCVYKLDRACSRSSVLGKPKCELLESRSVRFC